MSQKNNKKHECKRSRLPVILNENQKISKTNLSIAIQIVSHIVVCMPGRVPVMRCEQEEILKPHAAIAIKIGPQPGLARKG